MNRDRVDQIISGMKSFPKETYYKGELLDEMLLLQQEIIGLTFNDDHAMTADLRTYDVIRHLEQLNEECGHPADEELRQFATDGKKLTNLIKAEISGNRGEEKACAALERISSPGVVLRNIELTDGTLRTELDVVVITPKSLTIVEVKNSSKDIYIAENGSYYKTGEFLKWDCNIADKMALRERLLRQALSAIGITDVVIRGVVVFTNNHIEVQNRCPEIHTCFTDQLLDFVENGKSDRLYDHEDIRKMQECIDNARCRECYRPDFDVMQFKQDYAILMSILEESKASLESDAEAVERVEKANDSDISTIMVGGQNSSSANHNTGKEEIKKQIHGHWFKGACVAMAGVAVGLFTGMLISKR